MLENGQFHSKLDVFQTDSSDKSPFESVPSADVGETLPQRLPLSMGTDILPNTLFRTAFGDFSSAGGSQWTDEPTADGDDPTTDDIDALTGLPVEKTGSRQREVSSLLGGEFGTWNPPEQATTALGKINHTGSQHVRLAARLDQFWHDNRPTPERIDQHVLATHKHRLQPFLLIDYDDATIGKIEDFNWFEIGQAFATRFQPNSPWLTAQGIKNWGIEVYSIFNEPDIRSRWDTSDNGIGFDYKLYHDSIQAFAAGVHQVNANLKVIPGGFASHRESGDWGARGYGTAIADLLNDGTLDGLNLHNYDSLGKKAWTAQEQFRRHKAAMGVTADINYYVDEFNNSREGKTGSAFLTSIWDQLGVVGNAGNGSEGKTQFALPFTLNALESVHDFGLLDKKERPSDRVDVWKRLNELTEGMEFTHYSPNFFGSYELLGNGKKMWVWQNRKFYTGFPGKSVVLHGVPTDATKIEIHTYEGLYKTINVKPGQTSIALDQLPENQTLMFLANGTKVDTPGGIFGPLKIDFNPRPDHASSSQFQSASRQTYAPWRGQGWTRENDLAFVNRPVGNSLHQGIVSSQKSGEFKLSVPPGKYKVTLHLGDPKYARDQVRVMAERRVALKNTDTAAGEIKAKSFNVMVTDGILNIQLKDRGGKGFKWSLAGLEVTPLIPFS